MYTNNFILEELERYAQCVDVFWSAGRAEYRGYCLENPEDIIIVDYDDALNMYVASVYTRDLSLIHRECVASALGVIALIGEWLGFRYTPLGVGFDYMREWYDGTAWRPYYDDPSDEYEVA